jgi:hypothetical protein
MQSLAPHKAVPHYVQNYCRYIDWICTTLAYRHVRFSWTTRSCCANGVKAECEKIKRQISIIKVSQLFFTFIQMFLNGFAKSGHVTHFERDKKKHILIYLPFQSFLFFLFVSNFNTYSAINSVVCYLHNMHKKGTMNGEVIFVYSLVCYFSLQNN